MRAPGRARGSPRSAPGRARGAAEAAVPPLLPSALMQSRPGGRSGAGSPRPPPCRAEGRGQGALMLSLVPQPRSQRRPRPPTTNTSPLGSPPSPLFRLAGMSSLPLGGLGSLHPPLRACRNLCTKGRGRGWERGAGEGSRARTGCLCGAAANPERAPHPPRGRALDGLQLPAEARAERGAHRGDTRARRGSRLRHASVGRRPRPAPGRARPS